jgi:Leucine-rich repeat (LRR) protein
MTFLLFKPISKIRKLHLDSCKLYQLPIGVFSNFHYLEELTLSGNKLFNWGNGNDVFGNLTSIKHLDISGNRINIINETSFPIRNTTDADVEMIIVNKGFHGVHDSTSGL